VQQTNLYCEITKSSRTGPPDYFSNVSHRLRRAPRHNYGPCSSGRCTWRTVPPAGLPGSSGIPAQTRNGLIKLAVIKNRSEEEEERGGKSFLPSGVGSSLRRRGRKRGEKTIGAIDGGRFSRFSRSTGKRGGGVNRGKIICGSVHKRGKTPKRSEKREERRNGRWSVYSRKHTNAGTCGALRARPRCNFRVDY